MDVVAFFSALLGIGLASKGHAVVGIALIAGPLSLLAMLLARRMKPPLLLPFTFASWFVVAAVAILAMVVLRSDIVLSGVPLGMAFYYYGCVTLVERKARYSLHGGWFDWRIATRAERPFLYWLIVSFIFVVSGLCLAGVLANAFRQTLGHPADV